MTKLVRLLHLADSSIPTGSFAYSSGLESAITFRFVTNLFELRNYLYSFLQQAVSMEVPFLNSCHALQLDRPEDQRQLRLIAEEYDALMLVPALHRASVVQGKNWLKLLESLYPEAGMGEIREWFAEQKLPGHFVLVLALGVKRIGFSRQELQAVYLHMALRDQISAAIRLGFIGSIEGHRLQHDFYGLFADMLAQQPKKEYHEATRSAFLLDTAQVFHEDIYSKLFQN